MLSCAFPSNACLSPFPKEKDLSPLYAAAAKSLQSCPTLCDPIDSRNSPGKNTREGCHFLLQCMKVKSESEVAQLCPTLSDPMDCSLPGFSTHGIFQARGLEWGAIAFSIGKCTKVLLKCLATAYFYFLSFALYFLIFCNLYVLP